MTRWAAFAGLAGALVLTLLLLAHVTQRLVPLQGDGQHRAGGDTAVGTDEPPDESDIHTDEGVATPTEQPADSGHQGCETSTEQAAERGPPTVETLSPAALVLNVGLTQGLLAAVLVGGVVAFAVPPAALGVTVPTVGDVAVGAAVGVGLYLLNELGSAAADRLGVAHEERLREVLAPSSAVGWAALLIVALPLVAGFEELLFRGALVGALALGFDLSPWWLAVASSAAFGVGHGAQGAGGVVVTGALGMALAATFIWTGSLVAVVLAHYLVNALEFVVHEALGVEWADAA